jgi:hypothetical protein
MLQKLTLLKIKSTLNYLLGRMFEKKGDIIVFTIIRIVTFLGFTTSTQESLILKT